MQEYAFAERRATVERAAALCEISQSELLLLAGEMSAQELRTVKAVLANRAAVIRRLRESPGTLDALEKS